MSFFRIHQVATLPADGCTGSCDTPKNGGCLSYSGEKVMVEKEKSIMEREAGLMRKLTSGQMLMISIGSAIGTGLFLGSGFAISLAGPGVIFSYLIGAFIALTVMIALSEMSVEMPSAGSFGNFAETYLNDYAGFLVRWIYWFAQIIAIGGEMVAAGIYMSFWMPNVTPVVWIVLFAVVLLSVNAVTVKAFGTFEYWFSMIKVVTIVVFIILGGFVLLSAVRFGITPAYTAFGGFFPDGFKGVWLATVVALFSYIGVEVVAVTAGESSDPGKSVPRAMRGMVVRLVLFYVISLIVMVGLVPWTTLQGVSAISESPFVRAFALIGIPFAAAIMNFVVLTAALSSSNTDIYLTIRMLFSLSRAKRAPNAFGKLNRFKIPFNALIIAAVGIAFSIYLDYSIGSTNAYLDLFGIAVFGAIFTWIVILLSHLSFRRQRSAQGIELKYRIRGAPIFSVVGIGLLVSVLISTWFTPGITVTIPSGVVTVIFFSIAYLYYLRKGKPNE